MRVALEEFDFTADGCDPPVPHAGASSAAGAGDLADDITEELLHYFIE